MDGTKSTRTFGAESPFGKGHFLCFCVSVVFFFFGNFDPRTVSEAANSRWGGGGGGERKGAKGRGGEGGSEREREGGGRGDMGGREMGDN